MMCGIEQIHNENNYNKPFVVNANNHLNSLFGCNLKIVLKNYITKIKNEFDQESMKFEHQKVNFVNSDRLQMSDQQFLTFRHNNNYENNNTGRSIYSQKIELYKSLEKQYQENQENIPVRNFKKSNNLRAIRSQEKFQVKSLLPTKKSTDILEIHNNNTKFNLNNAEVQSSFKNSPCVVLDSNGMISQYQFRNEILRKKIHKLIKNIKNQQKRQLSLEKDLEEIQTQFQEDDKQIQKQMEDIEELQFINQENKDYLQKLKANLNDLKNKKNNLQVQADTIDQSLQRINSKEDKRIAAQKLKEGLVELQRLKNDVSSRCIRIENQIQKMKDFLQESQNVDMIIRDTTYSRQHENNSHFTC